MIYPLLKHLHILPRSRGLFLLALWEISGNQWIERSKIVSATTSAIRDNTRDKAIVDDLENAGLVESKMAYNGKNKGTCMVRVTKNGQNWLREGYELTKTTL